MSALADRRPSLPERALRFAERVVPKPVAWAFALRIWLAMVLALYAAFWLQLSSASSAAVCVAILAQPTRGQALSKALYRFLGTLVGAAVAIVLMALFAQDRVLLLVSFATWLGVCVFTAHFLQDTRAYGAMLSGYTVAIIAIAHIDTPQNTFDAAVDRVAAIALGIVAITFINDALGTPSIWRTVRDTLGGAIAETKRFVHDTLTRGDPGPERTAALIRKVAAMRGDAGAIAGERDDGPDRAAGARSAIAALYVMAAAARHFEAAAARLPAPSPAVTEARDLCLALTGPADDPARAVARLSDLVDAALRGGDAPLDEILALQRALDLARAARFAQDGHRVLAQGGRPLRDVPLPTHRDVPEALRGAMRVAVAFGLSALLLITAGWPATSFALVQVAATCALSSTTPDPRVFAKGVLIGMPLAALCAGIVLYGLLAGVQGFPLLAIAMAPVVFVACFLSLNPPTFGIGFILLVFFPVLLSPANPQSYDPQGFLTNAFLVIVAALILFFTVRVILPVSNARHRAFALDSARRALVDALAGQGGDAATRTSLNSDRLLQFARWSSGSGAVRRASLDRAFDLARMESAAARAHAQLRGLMRDAAIATPAGSARAALMAVDPVGMREAAHALLAAGAAAAPETRLHLARAVSDLTTAAHVAEVQGRFLRRLGVMGA